MFSIDGTLRSSIPATEGDALSFDDSYAVSKFLRDLSRDSNRCPWSSNLDVRGSDACSLRGFEDLLPNVSARWDCVATFVSESR